MAKDSVIRAGSKSIKTKKPDKPQSSQININEMELDRASKVINDRKTMNEDVLVLVPELKQARDIIVNSVISPNDYSKKELLSDFDNFLELDESIVMEIRDIIDNTVTKFKLVSELSDVVKESLFGDGAYPELIIPRSKITDIIKDGSDIKLKSKSDLESFNIDSYSDKLNSYGYVNIDTEKTITIDAESYSLNDLNVSAISNPLVLLIPEIYDNARKDIMDKELFLPTANKKDVESISPDLLNIYDKFKRRTKERYISINKDTKIESDDVPFRLLLSSSAVIPIYTDDRTNHLGYFVLANEMNRPITNNINDDELFNLYRTNSDNKVLKGVIGNASKQLDKSNDESVIISNMIEISGNILKQSLTSAMDNSIYKNNYNIDYENSIIKIMLARALEEKQTKLIFIPSDYMSYIAFDYRKNGTGKTLLEDITLLASFKAMLLLSQIHATVTSNIPVTDVVVDIDEKDPEPMKTKEMLEQVILNGGRNRLAWGETSIERFGNWIQNTGTRITYNHKSFPDTKITMEKKNNESSYNPDTSVMDSISNYMLRHLGLSPTILDDANQAEFASVAMINHAMSNKINNERQDILNDGMSDKLRKLSKADITTFNRYLSLVEKHSKKIIASINKVLEEDKITTLDNGLKTQIALDLIEGSKVRVPRAESKDNDELREKFSKYKDTVDNILEALTTSSFIEDIVSELGISKEILTNNIKLMALVDWCEEHNYARGMVKLINMRDKADIKAMLSRISDKDMNIIELAKTLADTKTKLLEKIKPEEEEVVEGGSESTDDSMDTDGGEEMDDNNLDGMGESDDIMEEEGGGEKEEDVDENLETPDETIKEEDEIEEIEEEK